MKITRAGCLGQLIDGDTAFISWRGWQNTPLLGTTCITLGSRNRDAAPTPIRLESLEVCPRYQYFLRYAAGSNRHLLCLKDTLCTVCADNSRCTSFLATWSGGPRKCLYYPQAESIKQTLLSFVLWQVTQSIFYSPNKLLEWPSFDTGFSSFNPQA